MKDDLLNRVGGGIGNALDKIIWIFVLIPLLVTVLITAICLLLG